MSCYVMLLFRLWPIPGLYVPFAHPFPPWGNHGSASPRSIQDWTKEGFEAATTLPANLPSRLAQTEEPIIDHCYMRWNVYHVHNVYNVYIYIWINVANKIQWACHALSPHLWSQQEFAKLQGQPWPWNNLARWNDEMAPHPIYLQNSIHDSAQGIHWSKFAGQRVDRGLWAWQKCYSTGGPLLRAPNPNVSTSGLGAEQCLQFTISEPHTSHQQHRQLRSSLKSSDYQSYIT